MMPSTTCIRTDLFGGDLPANTNANTNTKPTKPEVFEILKAQFPIDYEKLEGDLPRLWSRWDPSMDGQIQKHEFLGPDGLLAFVRQRFLRQGARQSDTANGNGGGDSIGVVSLGSVVLSSLDRSTPIISLT